MSMETGTGKLTVNARTHTGKGAARRLRASGVVPGVVYGATVDGTLQPLPVVVNVKALHAALDPVRKQNTVIELTVEGAGDGAARKLSALLKEYQLDILRREVTHVDLLAIDPNKEVVADVPLEFVGKHAGLIDGGLLHIVLRSVQVRCKPAAIPVKLPVDISPLGIGDVLHVSDVQLPAGVKAVTAGREAVISMVAPEKETAVEAAPDAAAAAAPAAGKDAKAAPAAAGKDAKAAPAAAGKAAAPAAKPAAKK